MSISSSRKAFDNTWTSTTRGSFCPPLLRVVYEAPSQLTEQRFLRATSKVANVAIDLGPRCKCYFCHVYTCIVYKEEFSSTLLIVSSTSFIHPQT
jgi:hypothetical protein